MHIHVKTLAQLSKVQTAFVFIRFDSIRSTSDFDEPLEICSLWHQRHIGLKHSSNYLNSGIGISFIHQCEKQLKFEILRSSGKVFSIRYVIIKKH